VLIIKILIYYCSVIKKVRLKWFGLDMWNVKNKDDASWFNLCTTVEADGFRQTKTWWDGSREDMKSFPLSQEDAQN